MRAVLPVVALCAISATQDVKPAPSAPAVLVLAATEDPQLTAALRAAGLEAICCSGDTRSVQAQLRERNVDTQRLGLHAYGVAVATALDLVMEQDLPVRGMTLQSGCEPVIEGLRRDVPVLVLARGDETPQLRACQGELAHQLVISSAPANLQTSTDPAALRALAVQFHADRLLDASPAPESVKSASRARALARVHAERGQTAAALAWLDRARTLDPSTVQDVACDSGLVRLRGNQDFSNWLRRHAPTNATLCTETEPGDRLAIRMRIVGSDGKTPLAGAILSLHQTDASGLYTHGREAGSDEHPRLAACVRADAEGRCAVRTIRPGGYPRTMIPSHIHVLVQHQDHKHHLEILFADDPRHSPTFLETRRKLGWLMLEGDQELVIRWPGER